MGRGYGTAEPPPTSKRKREKKKKHELFRDLDFPHTQLVKSTVNASLPSGSDEKKAPSGASLGWVVAFLALLPRQPDKNQHESNTEILSPHRTP